MQYNDGFNGDNWASHFKCYLTGMNHIYTHPSKGHATDIVKEYVSMVKTRYGRTIRFMRADGETALASQFEEFMTTLGITVERTAVATPAQNGNAERAGRAITTTARAIRIYARLPSNL